MCNEEEAADKRRKEFNKTVGLMDIKDHNKIVHELLETCQIALRQIEREGGTANAASRFRVVIAKFRGEL
ncbi:hypothetical protein KAR91_54825 [Candidatus Pacearchaeota archaeon]|nr:hypothetical protein [Candidatus Pacearchaeota archaeon]